MNKFTLSFILVLLLSPGSFAQTIIENPVHGMNSAPHVDLKKIEITDKEFILHFHTTFAAGNWISIPRHTYIAPAGDTVKSLIVSTEGIPLGERYMMPESGVVDYKLFFPKLGPGVKRFDYGEAGNGWHIYDIRLTNVPDPSMVPVEIAGHWFNEKNGRWEISFLENKVVFKKKLWNYDEVKLKKGEGSVSIKNGSEKISLIVKAGRNGLIQAGESAGQMITLGKNPSKIFQQPDQKEFVSPLFSIDSAVYSCWLRDYTPRIGRTGRISVNNILSGTQNTFQFTISDEGYFSVNLPVLYPHDIYIRSDAYNGSVFMEPGKEVLQVIDNRDTKNSNFLFMGDDEGINAGMLMLRDIRSFNYQAMQDKILEMTPAGYKELCREFFQKDLNSYSEISGNQQFPAKVRQLKQLQIEYSYFVNLMDYKMNFESTYRTKNNIPVTQRTMPVKSEQPDAAYYDFLTENTVHNPVAVLSNDYYYFINRLKYIEFLRGTNVSLTTLQIADELEKSGYKFTEDEMELVAALKNKGENNEQSNALREKYGTQYSDFYNKNRTYITELFNTKKSIAPSVTEIEKHLKEKGIDFTMAEKKMLDEYRIMESTDDYQKFRDFQARYSQQISEFSSRHNKFVNVLFRRMINERLCENLEKKLGVRKGLATDIVTSQDECRSILQEVTPLSEGELRDVISRVSTPFIDSYLEWANKESLSKVAAAKTKTGYTVNKTPVTEADKLFERIMQKYRGKVVYVDFWATWCGPCRSNIENIKPLKAEMTGKDVVFVYITNPTSPKETWDNMIPDIKGEHYRLSTDEWNYLSGKFNIAGIPHIVLVDRNGNVADPHFEYSANNAVKYQIEKLLGK